MDELFFLGQVAWIAVLAYSAYLSFANVHLADAEGAQGRRSEPDKRVAPAMPLVPGMQA